MKKNFLKKHLNRKRPIHKRKLGTTILTSAIASTLLFVPISPVFQNGNLIGFEQNTAQAAPLASVRILDGTSLEASIDDAEAPNPYPLTMTLTGRGLADVDVVNTEQVAVFYAPDLDGDLGENATADVRVELLPITMDDLPALTDTINTLTPNLISTVSGVITLIDTITTWVPLTEVDGLPELRDSLNALNNLDNATFDLLAYDDEIPSENITVYDNGAVRVNFSDGLDNHLDTTVNGVVIQLLQDIIDATQNVAVEVDIPLVGGLINGVLDNVLTTITSSVLPGVNTLLEQVGSGAVDLVGDLASARIIGNTSVSVTVPVDRTTDMAGQDVRVTGNAVSTANIDAELLSDLNAESTQATVTIPADETATTPTISPVGDVTAVESQAMTPVEVVTENATAVTVDGLPAGVTYDPETSTISGTPTVDEWVDDALSEDYPVTIEASDDAGNTTQETFVFTVQRDSDGDGVPDTEEPVDTTAPVITPIEDVTAVEGQAITPIPVETDEPATIETEGLPAGVNYDSTSNSIVGEPSVDNWEDGELVRDFPVVVSATDDAGNRSQETFVFTVQRDSDGDGIPDIDEPVDIIAPVITPIDNVTAIDGQPIAEITVEADEPSAFVVAGLPAGITYNLETSTIGGTPTIGDWDEGELTRNFPVAVEATDEAGNVGTESFIITVQRDSDGDGIPDMDEPIDTTAPVITPNDDVTAVEDQAIVDITVEADEPSTFEVAGLPAGVVYNPETSTIGGTPVIDDWDEGELVRNFPVVIEATDEAGNVGTESFVMAVQRDSNGDGVPDVEDLSDEDTTAPTITPIEDFDAVENQPIAPVTIETDEPSEIGVEGLPAGLTFDPETSQITGAPTVDDWTEDELTRDFVALVEATDAAGNTGLETFVITVQRDSNDDGTPDVDDPVDTTAPTITPIDNVDAVEDQPIIPIEVETDEPSDVEVDGLPTGVSYNPETSLIEGTPTIEDWTEGELSRGFIVLIEATDDAGNTGAETFVMTVQRDSDGDGIPDEDEDVVPPVITPIEDFDAVENQPITPVEVTTDEPSDIELEGLPAGITYNPETSFIEGTPTINDWGENEVTRDFPVVIEATDAAGNTSLETFVVTVQRDSNNDGTPDVEDPSEEDATAPEIDTIDDFDAVENQPITPVEIVTDEDSEIEVNGLPEGVTYNPETSLIEGVPAIDDWGENELARDYAVVMEATDAAGNVGTETFVVTVLRDSNNDGIPDIEDTLGSGDTTPPVITPIPDQDVVENEPIEDIVVETDEPSDVVIDGLPDSVTYDPETGVISGTPVINDWAEDETERTFNVTITAEDDAGNTSTYEFTFNIQRDLSGTGGTADGSDSTDQAGLLPTTGEAQSIITNVIGLLSVAIGSLLFAWNKKRDDIIEN